MINFWNSIQWKRKKIILRYWKIVRIAVIWKHCFRLWYQMKRSVASIPFAADRGLGKDAGSTRRLPSNKWHEMRREGRQLLWHFWLRRWTGHLSSVASQPSFSTSTLWTRDLSMMTSKFFCFVFLLLLIVVFCVVSFVLWKLRNTMSN